jgi:hypothetical protein
MALTSTELLALGAALHEWRRIIVSRHLLSNDEWLWLSRRHQIIIWGLPDSN